MAPGLSGRPTGTVPKKKIKSNDSQSQTYSQLSSLDWEHMSDLGNKKISYSKGNINSEMEGDSAHSDLERSRSSTTTSQNDNEEDHLQSNASSKLKSCDSKQVVSKLSQIQSYLQQTTDLMNALKLSDSPSSESGESRRMQKFNKIVAEKYGPIVCTFKAGPSKMESAEENLSRRSEESRKKLEFLQKRKQDLLKLQDKAKKQLQEAQAEQTRLMEKASCLNQEISSSKLLDLNVQHLNQRLKAVQEMYQFTNQINDSLNGNLRDNLEDGESPKEVSDSDANFQLMNDKLDELNAKKAQLEEIQKMMASISGLQNVHARQHSNESMDEAKEQLKHHTQGSFNSEEEPAGKLEQAKSKLNHLTQLLDIVQMAQNANNLPPPYLQLVTNAVNEDVNLSAPSVSNASESVTSPQKTREEISIETVQVMTRELEETTAAMKEERDKLEAARQELQNIAKRLPLNMSRGEILSPNDDSESEPPCLKSASLESSFRDILNMSGSTEAEQLPKCNDNGNNGSLNVAKRRSFRNSGQQQNGMWNSSSNTSMQGRHSKNETLSRSSHNSFRSGSHNMVRESRWSPAPSVTYSNERFNPVAQTQNQIEMSSNLCEMALSESGIRQNEITLQGMFNQHQLLTRTVAQCSQLLWLQQKQIIELRNAIMLQNGGFSNLNLQQMYPNQAQMNFSAFGNIPQPSFFQGGLLFPNVNPYFPISFQPLQNHLFGGEKLATRDSVQSTTNQSSFSEEINNQTQSIQHHFPRSQPLQDQQQNPVNYTVSDHLDPDPRTLSRLNLPLSAQNQNVNVASPNIINSRILNGLNCPNVTEEAGALNNQVPPGNRANNYWDNFRSYSRQNLLSNSKSNEGSDVSRRAFSSGGFDRSPRDFAGQNNQSGSAVFQQHQQSVVGNHYINLESSSNDQFLSSNQNCHPHTSRNRPVDSHSFRNTSKNESRHQENDAKILSSTGKNEEAGGSGCCSVNGGGCGNSSGSGARLRLSDNGAENIRNVRNDMGPGARSGNLTNSRNFNQTHRDQNNEGIPLNINKKRSERSRGRKDGLGNLNNRGYNNTSLWENISSEVSSFIRTNESRPYFLIQLFRDLQQVTTDNLRQRTLEMIQETLTANNLIERPNVNGGNVNLIENRNNNNNSNNNVRENRSNLNRNQVDDPRRIDDLFCQLRENQNTIRQNIGMSSLVSGGNILENSNISNIRDLVNSRNNLENEGLRDLRTYFEANLCNFGGHHSTLENPNLSNIRENLTRRVPDSNYDNVNPKNVYLSMCDNASVELRRRNLEQLSSVGDNDLDQFRNFEMDNAYQRNEYLMGNDIIRSDNNQYDSKSYEEIANGHNHYTLENGRRSSTRFSMLDGGDNFGSSRQFLPNVNDSGIDINFNNEERKRSYAEGERGINDGSVKPKENENAGESSMSSGSLPQWTRNSARNGSFESSSFIPVCENSFFNCRSFQPLDNGDLAEADQSRNDETSGAESDGGFILTQLIEPETAYVPGQSHQSSDSNFSSQNIPESERNFQSEFRENGVVVDAACGIDEAAGFPDSGAEPEGNFSRDDISENLNKNEVSENYYYFQLNGNCTFDGGNPKSKAKYRKSGDGNEKDSLEVSKGTNKNSGGGKSKENSFKKCNGVSGEDYEKSDEAASASVSGAMLSHSGVLIGNERKRTESRESVYSESFTFAVDKNAKGDKENTSPEAESDWECESGLDQVPTKLKKSGSSRKSDDSGGSIF